MRLLRGELRKLVKRPATGIVLVLLAVVLAMIYVGLGIAAATIPSDEGGQDFASLLTFPAAYEGLLGLFPLFGGLTLAIYAGLIVGSEWSWGTLRLAIARGEGRARYLMATFTAIAVLALVGLLVLFGLGVLFTVVSGTLAGFPTGDLGDAAALRALPANLILAWVGTLVIAALAYATSSIARSQVAGIGLVVALFFGEQFASVFIPPDVMRFAPLSSAGGLLAPEGSLLIALAVALAYLFASLVVAAIVLDRSEIT
jgi:hypothetical protein